MDERTVTEALPDYVFEMHQLLKGDVTREIGIQAERLVDQLRADLEDFNAEDVGKSLNAQRLERDRELSTFASESRKASESNALRDVERLVLKEAGGIDGVTAVLGLHETLVTKLKAEQEAHEKISRWESDQFAAAADRLKSFIASAASGLDLLKRICKSDDSSNMRFHIEVTVCDEAAVNSMLKTLFADFEQDWELREAAAQKRGETDDSVKKQDELLKDMIQKACFTKIFANPRIYARLHSRLPQLQLSALYGPMREALQLHSHPLTFAAGKDGQAKVIKMSGAPSWWPNDRGLDQEFLSSMQVRDSILSPL